MSYVIWDDERDAPASIMQKLPISMMEMSDAELLELGFRKLTVQYPEDYIPRFIPLLGSSRFEVQPDGSVLQTFPSADYSVGAVREELKNMARIEAAQVLGSSDWYIVRAMESGAAIPEDVTILRNKQRQHFEWISQQIDALDARDLIDYKWMYPTNPRHVMTNGVPVIYDEGEGVVDMAPPEKPLAPAAPDPLPLVPDPRHVMRDYDVEIPSTTDGVIFLAVDDLDDAAVADLRVPPQVIITRNNIPIEEFPEETATGVVDYSINPDGGTADA